jgi:hypothetical protein
LIPFSDQVLLRFVICDLNLPSLLEAAVDDLRIETYTASATAVPPWQPQAGPLASLGQGHPNPWQAGRGEARIDFGLRRGGAIALAVYDLAGRRVRTLAQGDYPAGEHALGWDGRDDAGRAVSAGVYFYRLQTGGEISARRLVLLR